MTQLIIDDYLSSGRELWCECERQMKNGANSLDDNFESLCFMWEYINIYFCGLNLTPSSLTAINSS